MRPVIFLGASTNLDVPLRIARLSGLEVAGIVDSDYYGNTQEIMNLPVLGSEHQFDWDQARTRYSFFIAQSFSTTSARNMTKRLAYIDLIKQHDLKCANLIHPHSEIYDSVELGQGCFVGYCSGISHKVAIGDHSQMHSFSIYGHDTNIGQNCCFNSYVMISAHITVGNNVIAMPGSAVVRTKGDTTIGDHAIIHPKVTVARSVDPYEIVSLAGDNTRRIYGEVIRT